MCPLNKADIQSDGLLSLERDRHPEQREGSRRSHRCRPPDALEAIVGIGSRNVTSLRDMLLDLTACSVSHFVLG